MVINTETGEAFATQRGYARMSGKDHSTIVKRCQGGASECIKTAEILTPGGLQGGARKRVQHLKGGDNLELKTAEILTVKGFQVVTLVPANLIFKWAMGDNPDLAYSDKHCDRISDFTAALILQNRL